MTTTLPTPPAAVPLPNLGRCPDCPDEIRIRSNGHLYAHGCTGDGSLPLLVLQPTFARWLWTQSKRRDDYTNPLTCFAGRVYRGCTRAPKRHAGDMPWSNATELHDHLHAVKKQRGGRDDCDWLCRDLNAAAEAYAQLAAAASFDGTEARDKEPGPIVRVLHRKTGWIAPDYSDFADCTTNYRRTQDGRPPCTDTAVWKVVTEHTSADGYPMLTIGFYCTADLPAEHRPAARLHDAA